jgi:Ca-activated chloride channel family protein
MVHFDSPLFFLLLLLVPLLFVSADGLFFVRRKQGVRKNAVSFSSPVPLNSLPVSRKLKERPWVLNLLRTAAFICFVVALARPQTGILFSEVEESGRDIMLAVDTSGSMNALDFSIDGKRVDRLAALKHVVENFIDGRKGDRMGLIVFGTDVFTQCPLTMDQSVLKDFVAGLGIGMVGEGTALGDAIAVAVKRLKNIPGDSKVIVLVTDGVKTAGNVEPKQAAEIAAKAGIKIYTIGIGGNKPAPFRVTGIFGEARLEYRPVELDEKTLREIAELTGGKYYNAQKTETLEDIYKEISKLEERVDKSYEYIEYQEQFFPIVCVGLIFLLIHELLASTRYVTAP